MSNSPLNKTIKLNKSEEKQFSKKLIQLSSNSQLKDILNKTINQNIFEIAPYLPQNSVDLLIIDPPYNLNKKFNSINFQKKSIAEYSLWLDKIIITLKPLLKQTASIYVCGDWYSSISIPMVLEKHFILRNRITWEREKGRGSKYNWKNNTEDIWFCTVGEKYTFNIEKIKLMKKVLAPYRSEEGEPKDWKSYGKDGFRLTFPSNIWTDISVPFWSMAENTEHPTQKPEKLIAKLILASTNKGDVVFDPFLGSGTTSVVSKKLQRNFIGVEMDTYYALLTEKRLELSAIDSSIQGYEFETFWERNTRPFSLKQTIGTDSKTSH